MRFASAYWELVRFDVLMYWRGFAHIYAGLRGEAMQTESKPLAMSWTDWRDAVELASVFYPSKVQCLQRSVALVRLLRRQGVAAELVIGVQSQPFSSHAWVEVNRSILNDFSTYPERMIILDRI